MSPALTYELRLRLAQGGMADVWLAVARDASGMETTVVVKTILPQLASDPRLIQRFVNEARLATRLSHPNIVKILDHGLLNEQYFIAMEHVWGRTLRQVQRASARRGVLPDPAFVLQAIANVCAGLQHAHDLHDERRRPLGLVHRDLSPENLIISFTGTAKILDFGLAKATARITSLTQPGVIGGKILYISPEEALGEAATAQSDIYALGVVLYELLTGQSPYPGVAPLDLVSRIARGDVRLPRMARPDLAPRLEEIILRAMALDPARRYQRADVLRVDILDHLAATGHRQSPRDLGEAINALFPDESAAATELDSGEPAMSSGTWRQADSMLVDPIVDPIVADESSGVTATRPAAAPPVKAVVAHWRDAAPSSFNLAAAGHAEGTPTIETVADDPTPAIEDPDLVDPDDSPTPTSVDLPPVEDTLPDNRRR